MGLVELLALWSLLGGACVWYGPEQTLQVAVAFVASDVCHLSHCSGFTLHLLLGYI